MLADPNGATGIMTQDACSWMDDRAWQSELDEQCSRRTVLNSFGLPHPTLTFPLKTASSQITARTDDSSSSSGVSRVSLKGASGRVAGFEEVLEDAAVDAGRDELDDGWAEGRWGASGAGVMPNALLGVV